MYRINRISLFLLILIGFSLSANAQLFWEEAGVPVRLGYHFEWNRCSITNQLGETYVVWGDSRGGTQSVYAQCFDIDGQQLWEEDGINIGGNVIYPEALPEACLLGDAGIIITWSEYSYSEEEMILRAQRIDREGNLLWDSQGIEVCTGTWVKDHIEILNDGGNGAFISWTDYRESELDIFAIRILSDGNVAPGWNVNGNIVLPEIDISVDQFDLSMCGDCESGIIIAWSNWAGQNYDIYAQRMSPDGNLLWEPAGMPVCMAGGSQGEVRIISDESGGAFCIWADQRSGGPRIYMQRIDMDGNPLWAINGIPVCPNNFNHYDPFIVPDGSRGAIVCWKYMAGSFNYDLYCQRIDENGNLLWTNSGVAISTMPNDQEDMAMSADGIGGAFFSWKDNSNGWSSSYINSQHIGSDGHPIWHANGVTICNDGANLSSFPAPNSLNDGTSMFVWKNWGGGDMGIHIQKVDDQGNIQLQLNGAPIVEGLGNDGEDVVIQFIPPDRIIATWRDGGGGSALRYQIFDMNGNIILPENGLSVSTRMVSLTEQQVTATTDGCAVIAYKDNPGTSNSSRIYAQKIDSQGNILWNREGIKLFETSHPQFWAQICSDNDGGAIIAFHTYNGLSSTNSDIYVQRVSSEGQLIWGNTAVGVTYSSLNKHLDGIVEDGEGGAIISWEWAMSSNNRDIYAARIMANGDTSWTRAVCNETNHQSDSYITPSRDGGAIIAWEDTRGNAFDKAIYSQKIDNDGNFLWADNGILVIGIEDETAEKVKMVEDDEGFIYYVFKDSRGGYRTLWCQRLNSNGQLMFPEEGVMIQEQTEFLGNLDLVPDGEGGVIVSWDDDRDMIREIYAIHLDATGRIADPVWNEEGNPICSGYGYRCELSMASDGMGGACIAWMDMRSCITTEYSIMSSWDIYIQRVNDYEVSAEEPSSQVIPAAFELHRNYPNPFNPTTTLSYSLPNAGKVSLVVYDVTGREVARLVDGMKPAGSHQVVFDAKDLSSGVYFARLEAGEFEQVRKILLVK